MKKEFVKSVLL